AVSDGHPPEGNQPVGALAQRIGVAVCTADSKHDWRAAAKLLLHFEDMSDLSAAQLLATLVEGDDERTLGNGRHERRVVLVLFNAQAAVGAKTLEVLRLRFFEVALFEPTNGEQ